MKHFKVYGLCLLIALCIVGTGCTSTYEYRSSQITSEKPVIGDQTGTQTRETETRIIREKPVIGDKTHPGAGKGAGWVE